jgi:cobalt-precorrin-5B (C1)-methyltransferase
VSAAPPATSTGGPSLKALRRGYTTGACAQAAVAAAAGGAVAGGDGSTNGTGGPDDEAVGGGIRQVEIVLPGGETACFPYRIDDVGVAWVVKDAGDDPDVTHGLAIGASVEETPGVFMVRGGVGVGTVTLPGLPVDPGEPAINPVPREAILGELRRAFPQGATATIHAPGGEELAGRTLNPRLGIVGGISILGTTGRVEPWSVEAMRESLEPQLDVAAARGRTDLVFVLGSKGRRLAVRAGTPEEDVIEVANEVGWMLERAAEHGFRSVTVRGHVGKLVKLAAGMFDTHSRVSDARLVTLAAYAGVAGLTPEQIRTILGMNTADQAARHLAAMGRGDVLALVAEAGARACADRFGLPVRLVMVDREGNVVGESGISASANGDPLSGDEEGPG